MNLRSTGTSAQKGRPAAKFALPAILFAVFAVVATVFAAPTTAHAATVVPVYRLYNPYTNAHLLTADWSEYYRLEYGGWYAEGVSFNTYDKTDTPVYRLYNPNNSDHFYTASTSEYESLQRNGWRGEGPVFYGVNKTTAGAKPVYRLWNSKQTGNGGLGSHHWTIDANENATLPVQSGGAWKQEGVSWYGLADTSTNKFQGTWWVRESGNEQFVLHINGKWLEAMSFYKQSVTNPGDGGLMTIAPFPTSPIASRSGSGYEIALKVPNQMGGYYIQTDNSFYNFNDDPNHLHRWEFGRHQVYTKLSGKPWYWPNW